MKKNLVMILFMVFNAGNCFAMCSVDDVSICTVSGFREQVSPIYAPKYNVSEFSASPEARLNPVDRSDIGQQIREFAPTESNYSYNSSCQFGVCMKNRNTPLFQQNK